MAFREEASLQPRRCSAALRVVLDRARTAPRVRIDACTAPRTYRRVCAAAPRTYRRVLPECAGSKPLLQPVKLATQRRIALRIRTNLRALVAVDFFSTRVFRLSFGHVYEVKKLERLRGLAACKTLASRTQTR